MVTHPRNYEPLSLLEYSVQRVANLGLMNEEKNHSSWAKIIFMYEPSNMRVELMSKVKREYGACFSSDFNKYAFLEDKIKKIFPQFLGEEEQDLFTKIDEALDAELEEQSSPDNKEMYNVVDCILMTTQDGNYLYKAELELEEGSDPHFSEGSPLTFRSFGVYYKCEVIEFDYVNATLFFSSTRNIDIANNSRILSDASFNTEALRKLLQEISEKEVDVTKPLYKFLEDKTRKLRNVPHNAYPSYLDKWLEKDESQQKAFKAALEKDITFVWGPPGTGKSYTLAAIIMALYHMKNERTAVCCLSNVAVDQLLEKVVDIIDTYEPGMQRGEFYRAGRTQDDRLIATDFLYPDDPQSEKLRFKIQLRRKRIEQYKKERKQYSEEAIKVKANLKDLREQLKTHTDYLIGKVKVVFSTISNFVINPRLKDSEFDNLIVDEASMLAQPQLIALARKVGKRIILVGDFQQLAPITTVGVPILKDSVFRLCGIDIEHADHPALHQLLNQRRSNPKIVDIINHAFYADKLHAENKKHHPVVAREPYNGCVIGMKRIENGSVRFTRGGTRQNMANSDAVMELLDIYSKNTDQDFSIGVITPYTGQVSLLKAKFIERNYPVEFQERVRIGTVHTFQGSECDVIIFDMVDCSKFEKGTPYFGKIFAGEQGEQLMNVAISRARHKLIVVCDPIFLHDCPGGKITDNTYDIFKELLKTRNTKQ